MSISKGKILIRQAASDDAVLISALAATTFYEAYFEQDEPNGLAAYIHESFAVDKLSSEIEDHDSAFFIAFLEGKAVGYARLIADSQNANVSPGKMVELRRIYILERVWKTGVGKALLEHCIEHAANRDFDTLWLGVWEENIRAEAFYKRFGFRQVGTLNFPYGDLVGTNLVLELPLR